MHIRIRDFPIVQEAKRIALAQLAYYLEMMKEKDENQDKREATAQSPSRTLPTAKSWQTFTL